MVAKRSMMGNSADQGLDHLFRPIKIGRVELKNRIIMPSVVDRLPVDGIVTEAVKDFYSARARGGVGLIILTPGIIDSSMPSQILLGIYEDRFIPKLRELTDLTHACGTPIGIELMHFGRQGETVKGYKPVAPSPIPWSPHAQVPRELVVGEIEELIEKFSDGALRAKEAGFDLVEIHASHGYLLSSFLSPHSNKRNDKYGGDIEGRARFVIEIVQRIKEKLGSDFPVSCRINGADHLPGGLTPEMAATTARLLEEAGVDMIGVSAGAFGSYPVIIPPYDQPYGCYVPLGEEIKGAVNVPVAVAGRLDDPWVAEEALASGKADLVAIARGLLADPDLVKKVSRGEFEEIRKCIACNACLEANVGKPMRCTVNPEAGREKEMEIAPASQPKKVLVIGGGPAGLEAARVAALRKHHVSLYEEDEELGGQWLLAATPPHKQGHRGLIDYLSFQLEKLGVELNLGKKMTAAMVKDLKPDVVVVATGAKPWIPPIEGVDQEEVTTAWDVLGGQEVGPRVLVIGGGETGLETAEYLLQQGKDVVVVEQLRKVGADMGRTVRWHLMNRLKGQKIEMLTSTEVQEIRPHGVVTLSRGGQDETWKGFDAIVLACGVKSRNEIFKEIEDAVGDLYVIGDAAEIRGGLEAMGDGAEIGRKI